MLTMTTNSYYQWAVANTSCPRIIRVAAGIVYTHGAKDDEQDLPKPNLLGKFTDELLRIMRYDLDKPEHIASYSRPAETFFKLMKRALVVYASTDHKEYQAIRRIMEPSVFSQVIELLRVATEHYGVIGDFYGQTSVEKC